MRRALGAALLALALTGCASPEAELRNAVADLTDAANSQDADATVREAEELLTLVEQQRDDLGTAKADRMRQYALAVRDGAEALEVVETPTPSPTPSPTPEPEETEEEEPPPPPSPTRSPTPSPTPEPVRTTEAPEPEPTEDEAEPSPTLAPATEEPEEEPTASPVAVEQQPQATPAVGGAGRSGAPDDDEDPA